MHGCAKGNTRFKGAVGTGLWVRGIAHSTPTLASTVVGVNHCARLFVQLCTTLCATLLGKTHQAGRRCLPRKPTLAKSHPPVTHPLHARLDNAYSDSHRSDTGLSTTAIFFCASASPELGPWQGAESWPRHGPFWFYLRPPTANRSPTRPHRQNLVLRPPTACLVSGDQS